MPSEVHGERAGRNLSVDRTIVGAFDATSYRWQATADRPVARRPAQECPRPDGPTRIVHPAITGAVTPIVRVTIGRWTPGRVERRCCGAARARTVPRLVAGPR